MKRRFVDGCCYAWVGWALFGAAASGDTLRVPEDFPTIQEAIVVAVDGDTVLVADGVYRGELNRNITLMGKAITVRSENGPENCIIDCEQLGRGFQFVDGETAESVVDGFTIRKGYADDFEGYGGGILCDWDPTIRNCWIVGCSSEGAGGGVSCVASSPRIESCLISGNRTRGSAGGVYLTRSNAVLTNCTIVGNTSGTVQNAGGVRHGEGAASFYNCVIAGNTAGFGGGGVWNGGGTEDSCACPTFVDCQIIGNRAGWSGGGVDNYSGNAHTTLLGTTIAWNDALHAGAYDGEEGTTYSCVVWGNSPVERPPRDVIVRYSDFEGGKSGYGNINADPQFVPGATGTWTADGRLDPEQMTVALTDENADWKENEWAGAFINPNLDQPRYFVVRSSTRTTVTMWAYAAQIRSGKPLVDAGMAYRIARVRLGGDSPCIDFGDPRADGRGRFDLDGEPRIMGGRIEMGADEHTARPFVFGDMNCDGICDFDDLDGFVLALIDAEEYGKQFPECDLANGDIDASGAVDFGDVDGFVVRLGN
jgi:hypothetical protein